VRGIEVTDDSVSLDVIKSTCLEGPGHFLGSEQTLSLMQTEYIYPSLGDRSSPKEWVELGKPNLVQKAIEKKENILNNATKKFDPSIDNKLRSAFNIHLA
jgi:trimethylamine--corrinoid protein Co-methyltransferase